MVGQRVLFAFLAVMSIWTGVAGGSMMSMHAANRRKTVKTAAIYSLIGVAAVVGLYATSSITDRIALGLFALAMVVGPWVSPIVANIPPRQKTLGHSPDSAHGQANDAAVVLDCGGWANGFFIEGDDGLIVTVCHALSGSLRARLRVHTALGGFDFTVLGLDPNTDLAVIRSETPHPPIGGLPLAESTADLTEGELLTRIGYRDLHAKTPNWERVRAKLLRVTSIRQLLEEQGADAGKDAGGRGSIVLVEMEAKDGDSGSAVVDANGKVVGALSSSMKDGSVLLVGVDQIRAMVDGVREREALKRQS